MVIIVQSQFKSNDVLPFRIFQELLEYLDGLIKEYDKYVVEDGNLREDVTDKQSAEIAVEEIQLRYNSFVNTNPLLRELSQRGKDNPPGSQVCISPVNAQSSDDFLIEGEEENTDSIITDTIAVVNVTAYNTNQMELNESIANDKDNYNNSNEHIAAHEEESVDERIIIGIPAIGSTKRKCKASPSNHMGVHDDENIKEFKSISECNILAQGVSPSTTQQINKHDAWVGHKKNVTSEEAPYKCDTCGKGFEQNYKLTCHLLNHAAEKERNTTTSNDSTAPIHINDSELSHNKLFHAKDKTHKCKICGQCFGRKGYLKCHLLIHTGEKPYKCTKCGKCFRKEYTLSAHMRIHTGEKPYKCEVCEKSFALSATLKRHFQVHTDEKPLKCSECDKSFKHENALEYHLRIHTGKKPYTCMTCQTSVTTSSNLSRNKRIHANCYWQELKTTFG